jgi:hypothetical protein
VLPGAGRRLDRPAVTPIMAIPPPPGEGGRPYGARVPPRVAAPGRVPGPVRRAPRRRRPSSRTGRPSVPTIRIQSDNAFDSRDQAAAPGVGPQGLADQHRLRATARRPRRPRPPAPTRTPPPADPSSYLAPPGSCTASTPAWPTRSRRPPSPTRPAPPPARGGQGDGPPSDLAEAPGRRPQPPAGRGPPGATTAAWSGPWTPFRPAVLGAERHPLSSYIYLTAFWVG